MAKIRLSEKWETILEERLTKYGFNTFRFMMNEAKKTPEDTTSTIISVSMQGRKQSEFRVEFLIIKSIGEADAKTPNIDEMFMTEHTMFSKVMPKFDEMQSDLSLSAKFKFPTCYGSASDYIIMSDLTMENFAKETDFLDFEKTAFAMTELARFHSFSLALSNNKPQQYAELIKGLDRGYLFYNNIGLEKFESILNAGLRNLEYEEMRNRFSSACKKNFSELFPLSNGDSKCVIIHGDYTKNNLLYRCDEDGEPTDLMMLDFQYSCVASPVVDILVLLLTSSSNFLDYERFLDIYHDAMRMFLKKFCCRVDDLYDKKTMLKDFKQYLYYGVIIFLNESARHLDEEVYVTRMRQLVRQMDLLKLF